MIEVDCRKCVNCTGEECIPFGKDANVAVKKCADDSFKNYVTVEELKKCETVIGYLKKGDVFDFDGKTYRVSKLIENTNGCVSCIDVKSGKSRRFHIDTDVKIVKQEINNGLE